MPAVSKAQRRFFGWLEHTPGAAEKRGVHMTREQMHDFAATPDTGLPERVRKGRVRHSGLPRAARGRM